MRSLGTVLHLTRLGGSCGYEDKPKWLDTTTEASLKIKIAAVLVGVSGIHLPKSFIELGDAVDLGHSEEEYAAAACTISTRLRLGLFIYVSIVNDRKLQFLP